jgi:mono/diheme cytochrome c family protein
VINYRLVCLVFLLASPEALVCASAAADASITLQRPGTSSVIHTTTSLAGAFTIQTVTIPDPVVGETRSYRGVAMRELMESVYGSRWHTLEELLITCTDGYQPSLPVDELHRREAYLVFETADGKPFTFVKKSLTVPLGPFYLAWSDGKNSDAGVWSYQMTGIEPISFAQRFPKTAPPDGSDEIVNQGFTYFRHHCITCHKINGQGGDLSVELNYPVSVTEYWKPEYLTRYLMDPASIRHGTRMPPVAPGDPNREERIKQVVAYLQAMASKKINPAD